MTTLQNKLEHIFTQALEEHWWEVEDEFKKLAMDYVKDKSPYWVRDAVANATAAAINTAAARHVETTFAQAVNAIAKAQARAQLAKRLKARGMSTSLLDEWPAEQDTQ